MSYHGRTFSPADQWYSGTLEEQREFALHKIGEVMRLLVDLAAEAENPPRRWWRRRPRVDRQRVYDLQDAATTLGDAVSHLRERYLAAVVWDYLNRAFPPGTMPGSEDEAFQEVERLRAWVRELAGLTDE